MTILELDIGNTRIKWRLLNEQTSSSEQSGFALDLGELFEALSAMKLPLMVRMSSVKGGETSDAIERWVNECWSLPVHIARVRQNCGGVRNQYMDQSRLGVDRWLAILAAYRITAGACVIIDSGTALTIDVVDKHGLHLGGYITPGLLLMRKSLEQNTRIRLSDQFNQDSLTLGNSTDSAVRNGTLAAQVSLINTVVTSARNLDASSRVFFAGGDAELLATQSIVKMFDLAPSLVLDGLAIACPFSSEH